MTISADGCERSGVFCGVAVANGAFTGGGMNLAPDACMNDHLLDLLVMNDLSVRERLRYFPMIYSGAHVRSPRFSYSKVFSVTLQSDRPVPVAADGELLGTTPCTIETVPSALTVRC
jgi:diacylglycerol kinase (ATP)